MIEFYYILSLKDWRRFCDWSLVFRQNNNARHCMPRKDLAFTKTEKGTMRTIVSQLRIKREILQVHFKTSVENKLVQRRWNKITLFRNSSGQILHISQDAGSTNSLDNVFLYFITLIIKRFFLKTLQNFCCSDFSPLPS